MRVLFACRKFGDVAGGVERMSIALMNELAARGYDVALFTWDRADARAYYPMAAAIRWYRLDMGDASRPAGVALRVRRARRFRAIVGEYRPDVVVGFQHGPFLFAATSLWRGGIPVVLSERNAPDLFDHTRDGRFRRATFASMRLATAITVQFDSYIARYPAYLRARIVAIPNPVYRAGGRADPAAPRPLRTLLSLGRLSYQKNFGALLRAFAALAGEFADWRLRIVGNGEEQEALARASESLGIAARVSWAGAVRDVSSEYQSADLFCLPSRFEGFPNAIGEAMAHGLPVVGYRGCAGMSELISPGQDGILADGNGDPSTLAAALRPLMRDAALRSEMGAHARRIVDVYPPSRSFDAWERLLHDLAVRR